MRLIDADKLKDTILLQDGVNTKTWEQLFKFTVRAIDNAPTVEPEITEKQAILLLINNGWLVNHDKELREKWERPQGKWINQEQGAFYPIECSNCHNEPFCNDEGYVLSNYCPNCGAKMDKEADNETN